MSDWFSRQGQRQGVVRLALDQASLDDTRYYAALVSVVETPAGQILLENWVQAVLLKAPQTPEEVGELRFVQRVFADLRRAHARQERTSNGASGERQWETHRD